jgi:translocator protein
MRQEDREDSAIQKWGSLLVIVLLTFGASVGGSAVTESQPGSWYAQLDKPAFNPPSWLFGPVWTVLYLMMSVAAWRIWRRYGTAAAGALGLFAVQLALNFGWSFIFFGMQEIGLALAEIIVYALVILATIVVFYRRDRIAGLLLVPLLAWVLFAAALNFAIWRLNPGA